MDRYRASSRHYDTDSASDTDYDSYPRSSGPSHRLRRARRGPTLGHPVLLNPYASDDDSDYEPGCHHHHHGHEGGARDADPFDDSDHENDFDISELHIYDGPPGGARGADLFSSDEDSDIEPRRPRHIYGRGRVGAQNLDGPPVVVHFSRVDGSHPSRCVRNFTYSADEVINDDDDEEQGSEGEHHAARGGRRRRPEMRFDTDSSADNDANPLSRGSYGFGGRRLTALYPPRRGRASQDSSSDESASERYMASSRRGRGTTGAASRGGVMATPTPPLRSSHGRAQGNRQVGARGNRP